MSHSLSPPMHNAALKYCHLEGSYGLLDIAPADLGSAVARMKAEGYTGFNVTIPHKDAIYRMASGHTKESTQAQASNTVKILEDGSLLAHNTDIGGFEEALAELVAKDQSSAAACVIGTGGAAKAAILALANFGFGAVSIVSRDAAKAAALAKDMDAVLEGKLKLTGVIASQCSAEKISVIVNSTPMGQNAVPVPDWMDEFLAKVDRKALVFDMVYSKTKDDTPVVALAKSKGLQAADGAEMLIRQAHKAFQFWTNETPPVEIFRTAFKQSLAHQI
ncbi:MAG: shikimate dehydrogenase [Candidatus Melainabacteria bacterium]|nr:shikimate dehydrogenase [Candidatus Melainabacteria bacterium]